MVPSKEWITVRQRSSTQFAVGCKEFLDWAFGLSGGKNRLRCPCRRCRNTAFHDRETLHYHIFNWGFYTAYKFWEYHGEQPEESVVLNNAGGPSSPSMSDEFSELLEDVGVQQGNGSESEIGEAPNADALKFYGLVEDGKTRLHSGKNENVTRLSYVVKLLHQKCLNKWTNKSMDSLLRFNKHILPADAIVPESYYDAKKIVKQLGLDYVKIDACVNDCVLYWKEFEKASSCPTCGESRWKIQCPSSATINPTYRPSKTKVPRKTLRYFPVTKRLQRLYMCRKTAKHMRWHKEGNVENGAVKHPADSEQWKSFDRQHQVFAADPRSVRLGLASDGFNPFGSMSTTYSIWPVVLLPYNLPPWLCMKEPYFMMALLIPGKSSPGNDIDVYLQPLIDELKHLWETGVETFDAYQRQNFTLRAAVIWTINDFPAYGNLSGWRTKGKLACPCCGNNASYQSLRSKIGYMGHRRFLPRRHRWRVDAASFDGTKERRDPPPFLHGDEVLEQLEKVGNVVFGKKNKRKRETQTNWTKKSIFFELPYWRTLLVRHNLDVMHVERNVSDSILGTLMGAIGKTKDTVKARCDLVDLGIRKELHPYEERGELRKPNALYNLSPAEKSSLCKFLTTLKVPDGFASNIGRCVGLKDRKISGLKCHDHHVFLQCFLPFIAHGLLRKEVAEPLYELSIFFRDLCSKVLYRDKFEGLEKGIAVTMCKLEKVFPPAFFDIMVHLPIHLVNEAKLAGPVQYRWMYPIERYLRTLKSYVRTTARPEGSIAEGYIVDECLTFCSRYINSMETKFNRPPITDDRGGDGEINLSIFNGQGRPKGACTHLNLSREEYKEVWMYVLQNCEEISPYIEEHKAEIAGQGVVNVNDRHKAHFPQWFYAKVSTLNKKGLVDAKLLDFAMGPHQLVHRYDTYVVNGFKFHSKSREVSLQCQNSGVVVRGDDCCPVKEYYGVITDIYRLSFVGNNVLYVFKCHWWDVARQGVGYKTTKWGVTWLNRNRKLETTENYVLASQCAQVYYISDMKSENWMAVAKNFPRDVYAIPPAAEGEDPIDDTSVADDAYQESGTDPHASLGVVDVDGGSHYSILVRTDFEVDRVEGRLKDFFHDGGVVHLENDGTLSQHTDDDTEEN